ncbi:DUF881 domain-containing protein [Brachybacterium sp. FME24]|uniref:DUF881 domain-containing protein n=1 Tax=Brachybacterium sp. FME24 TaxID=2742605 RepID=UPI0018661F13|nr:DUF881 domain-containing protein [Brachybacterium sp. FME24]
MVEHAASTPDPERPPSQGQPPSGDPSSSAVKPPGSAGPGRRGRVGLALVMVLCGVLFATTARISGGGSIRDESGDVAGVLRDRGRTIEELTEDAADKRAQIAELSSSSADAVTEERTSRVANAVGLSEVSGEAVKITLTDAPTSKLGSMPDIEPDDLVVHQQDMESYINALWAGGAEAMMLQDQRVVNGSAFRCAGNTLLLEGRVYSPPFVITVIGPTEQMLAVLEDTQGVQVYREWVDYVGLGERIDTLDTATLPAFEGSLTLDLAKAE